MEILISNKKEFDNKVKNFKKDGADKIHVLSDFDRTFTNAFVNGEKVNSVLSIIRDGTYLTKDYAERAHALFNKYNPIEVNSTIPMEEKEKAMHEWWSKHFELLIECGLKLKDIERATSSAKLKLREGTNEFIKRLSENKIPLVFISSSGLGTDSLSMLLKREKSLLSNVHIICNEYIWDKNGKAIGVKEPIIHVLNKKEVTLHGLAIYSDLKKRTNVVLIGDGLGDVDMVEGFPYNNLLKIGFLNYEPQEKYEDFKKIYDVVIRGKDSDFSYVNELLSDILNSKS